VDEGMRFLRYAMPGAVFLVELAVLLAIASPDVSSSNRALLENMNRLAGSWGSAVSAVVACIAAGVVLSMIHHALCRCTSYWNHAEKMRDALAKAEENGLLELKSTAGERARAGDLTCAGGWTVFCSIYDEMKAVCPMMSGGKMRRSRNADLMHMAGTTFIGSVMAGITCVLFLWRYDALALRLNVLCAVLVWILLFCAPQLMSFLKVTKNQSSLVNTALLDALEQYHSKQVARHALIRAGAGSGQERAERPSIKTVWVNDWDLR
jgi:hypothetical protein